MRNATKHVTRFVVLDLEPLFERLHQRLVAGLVALHYLAHGFVDYYYMIVFVYYFHCAVRVYALKNLAKHGSNISRHASPQNYNL